ncbi:MAG: hypothetical protein ACO1OQ_12810 [Rufibacter sp.]
MLAAISLLQATDRAYTVAIAEGVYKENIQPTGLPANNTHQHVIKADGTVKLRATGNNRLEVAGNRLHFIGFIFEDYVSLGVTGTGSGGYFADFTDCEFRNCTVTNRWGTMTNCTFKSSVVPVSNVSANTHGRVLYCKILEGSNVSAYYSDSCDKDASSFFTMSTGSSSAPATWHFRNNMRGNGITVSGTNAGAVSNANLATFQAANPAWVGHYASDVFYAAPMAGVYVVAPNSPNLRTGLNGGNVGNVQIGKAVLFDQNVNGDNSIDLNNPNVILSEGIQVVNGAASLKAGYSEGTIESDWVLVNNGGKVKLKGLDPANNMEFNASIPGPNIENMNVLDSDNGTPHPNSTQGDPGYNLSADRNPNRLTYQCMWSISISKPASYAQADNSGFIPAGTWGKFLWKKPTMQIDANGRTDGEADFNWQQVTPFYEPLAVWAKYLFTLRDNYTS